MNPRPHCRLPACGAALLALLLSTRASSALAASPTNIDQSDQSARLLRPDTGSLRTLPTRDPPFFALAGGSQFGLGFLVPNLRQPVWHLAAQLGGSIHMAPELSLLITAQLGLDAVFNTVATADTNYGYAIRVPLHAVLELIHSNLFDYARRRYLNMHYGIGFGGDFLLAANCAVSCSYIPAGVYPGFFGRLGLSYSVDSRNALGLNISPHLTVASTLDPRASVVHVLAVTVALAYTFF